MQLKHKITHLTGIFFVLFGIAGGGNLWLMQNRMKQALVVSTQQNASLLSLIGRIEVDGVRMTENVNNLDVIEYQIGELPLNETSEAAEILEQFNNNYSLLQQDLRGLENEEEGLFCNTFLVELDGISEHLYQSGLKVFMETDEISLKVAREGFTVTKLDFLEAIEKAQAKQADYQLVQADAALTHSELLFWAYCAAWFVISVLGVFVMNQYSDHVTNRLGAMSVMVEKAGTGKFFIRLQDDEKDELGDLARKMNVTAAYLAETRQNLEETTKALALQLEERRAAEARLAEAATHDSLTGLPNRASFFEQFNHALALAYRQQGRMALLFLDMDGLKIVNDAFGHDGGDMLIRQVGERLQGNIRKSDYVARLAGDEFVVILENLQRIDEDVSEVCTKLLKVLAEPYDIRGRRIKLTASIGVSLFPTHGSSAEELLHKADSAMYWVKNGGKNDFAVYESVRD